MGEMGECDSGECGVKNHVFDEGGGAAGGENWVSFSLCSSLLPIQIQHYIS